MDVVKTRLQTQNTQINSFDTSYINPKTTSGATRSIVGISQADQLKQPSCCRASFNQAIKQRTSDLFSLRSSKSFNPSSSISSNHSVCLGLSCSSSFVSPLTSNNDPQLWSRNSSSTIRSCPDLIRPSASTSGIIDSVVQIIRFEGVRSLWKGLGPALVISVPAQAAYMFGYDSLRKTLQSIDPNYSNTTSSDKSELFMSISLYQAALVPLASGAIARSTIAIFFSPLELIRTKLQSSPAPLLMSRAFLNQNHHQLNSSPSHIVKALLILIRSSGFKSLYAGLPATLWRDVPFSAIYWTGYETMRRLISRDGGGGFGESDLKSTSVRRLATESFIAGSLSGSIAAVLTNGFDVIKTRRQAQEGVVKGQASSRRVGTLRMIVEIGRKEGFRDGLMKGLSPRLAKIVPSCGIMIASYEGLARVFAKYI
ncbi:mitochondrial carrier domain-containing protein [Phakopsora pachyrhizi]|nr:mitochondrial carrier domain-containing protein [Phakopsora pachyrhizi]